MESLDLADAVLRVGVQLDIGYVSLTAKEQKLSPGWSKRVHYLDSQSKSRSKTNIIISQQLQRHHLNTYGVGVGSTLARALAIKTHAFRQVGPATPAIIRLRGLNHNRYGACGYAIHPLFTDHLVLACEKCCKSCILHPNRLDHTTS